MTERGERIGAEVGGLKTRRASACDVENVLEVLVQRIEETVGKTLEILCG